MRESLVQLGTAIDCTDKFDTEAKFGNHYDADMQLIKGTRGNELNYSRFGPRPAQF